MRHVADTTLWISEAEVVEAVDLRGALALLEEAFAAEGAGALHPLDKTMATLPSRGTLHSLGAASQGLAAVKSWAHTPGGADPAVLVIDAADGSLVAVVEAFALGQLRTAATAGLATDRLAAPGVSSLAVIGTGKQALAQVAAVAAVRPIATVRAFSPTAEHREAFAVRVGDELGLDCRPVASVEEAVAGAGVVTLVTRATAPVLSAAMVEPGVHVNAVGAIDLARSEFEPALLERVDLLVTDSIEQTRRLSAELRSWFADDEGGWEALRSLGEVVHGGAGRTGGQQVTLFKGMGSGTEDLALAAEIYRRVRDAGGGQTVARRGRRAPALRTDDKAQPGERSR